MGKSFMEKLDDFLQLEVHVQRPYLREPAQKIPCPECSQNIVAVNNGQLKEKIRKHMARAHPQQAKGAQNG